jgi:Uncharacterized protein conserved in bacteria
MKQHLSLGAALLACAAFSAPALASTFPMPTISDAHIVLGKGKAPAVAYFKLHNGTSSHLALSGLRSPGFGYVMMHVSSEGKNTVAPMQYKFIVELPAGRSLDFSQKSMHLVLSVPKKQLKAGDEVPIRFGYNYGTEPWQTVKFKVENGQST